MTRNSSPPGGPHAWKPSPDRGLVNPLKIITSWLLRPPWNNLSFRRNDFYSDIFFVRRFRILFFLSSYLYGSDALNSSGGIAMALFCCFRFSFPQRLSCWTVHGTVDDLMFCCLLALCPVCQIFFIRLFALELGLIDRFINRLIDWLIDPSMFDWLVDRPIDRSIDSFIHSLAACWLTGYSGSFLRYHLWVLFYSVPCAHERCDPCEFLLALPGFVELM